jgi:acetyl-CoA carboxylase beta subunit
MGRPDPLKMRPSISRETGVLSTYSSTTSRGSSSPEAMATRHELMCSCQAAALTIAEAQGTRMQESACCIMPHMDTISHGQKLMALARMPPAWSWVIVEDIPC